MIINLPTKRSRVTSISNSCTHKMAVKTSWHRYGTKLRHRHSMYSISTGGRSTSVRGRVRSPHMAKLQAASLPIA